ncbi:hypothetical protein MOUN0_O04896 [Monosporozyma unispora]
MLKNFTLNAQTRVYHIRHWIDKIISFPKCIDLPPYPDKAFADELIVKCKIYHQFDNDELLSEMHISENMALNDIIQRIDLYHMKLPKSSGKNNNTSSSINQTAFLAQLNPLTTNPLESRINTSNSYRITKPNHTIASNIPSGNRRNTILSLGSRNNSTSK